MYSQAQQSLSHWARQEGDGTRCSYEIPPKKVIWNRVRTSELAARLVLNMILIQMHGAQHCLPMV